MFTGYILHVNLIISVQDELLQNVINRDFSFISSREVID
jgi:hypothetical protein